MFLNVLKVKKTQKIVEIFNFFKMSRILNRIWNIRIRKKMGII